MRIDLQASDFLLTGIVAITQGCKSTLLNLSFDYYFRIFDMFICLYPSILSIVIIRNK